MIAILSPDGRYRYALTRDTGTPGDGTVLWVMLNPSTADATEDDPTIRKCLGFARRWGFARISVGNLYGLRATDPRELGRADDPVGPENDDHLIELGGQADEVVFAWGARAELDREERVWDLLGYRAPQCLGFTLGFFPRHPLYVPYSQPRSPVHHRKAAA